MAGADGMVSQTTGTERPPTLHDVARAAGVSHQTVSRVINDGPNVSDAMRSRVLKAVESTHYRRNFSARALKTSMTGNIGVLIPTDDELGIQAKVRAVEAAARSRGYSVLVSSADPGSPASLRAGIASALSQPIDGLITIIAHERFTQLAEARRMPIPHLMLMSDAIVEAPALSDTGTAGQRGARLVTAHLLELGHTQIAHIPGPEGWISAQSRADGYRAEMAARRLPSLVSEAGDWSAESGYRVGAALLRDYPQITAVFTANDQMAIGLMHAARLSGRVIPADLSVVGFDDLPESAYLAPPLTTLRKDEAGLAELAVTLLLGRIRSQPTDIDQSLFTVEPTLIIRESSGPRSA